jgi:hypothetical protein
MEEPAQPGSPVSDTSIVSERHPGWRTWGFVTGLVACALIGWVALIRGRSVPVLALLNLGFHELGHLVTYPSPTWSPP